MTARGRWSAALVVPILAGVGCGAPLQLRSAPAFQRAAAGHMWSTGRVQCQFLDAQREPMGEPRSCRALIEEGASAPAAGFVRITPHCSGPVDLPLREATDESGGKVVAADFDLGWKNVDKRPEVYFTAGGDHGKAATTVRAFEAEWQEQEPDVMLWQNLKLKLVAALPDAEGNCSLALVTPANFNERPAEPMLGYMVVSKADLAPQPRGELSPLMHKEQWTEIQRRAQLRENQSVMDEELKVSEGEIASGQCTPRREQRLLELVEYLVARLGREGLRLTINDLGVAVPEGTALSWQTSEGGRYHILTAAFTPMKSRTRNASGDVVDQSSRYEAVVKQNGFQADSAFGIFHGGEDFSVDTVGSGCFLVAAFRVE